MFVSHFFCLCSVGLVFVCIVGINVDEWILFINMANQFIFDRVVGNLIVASILYGNGDKLTIYFDLTVIVLNTVFVLDIFCNISKAWIISTTISFFLFFSFGAAVATINNSENPGKKILRYLY